MAEDDALFEKGMPIRREVLGPEYVDASKAALLHATAYCGTPAGLDAFRAAHEVLVAEGALGKK